MDREKESYYLVHVEVMKVCSSGGGGGSIARTTINITVEDTNDNYPLFPVKKVRENFFGKNSLRFFIKVSTKRFPQVSSLQY